VAAASHCPIERLESIVDRRQIGHQQAARAQDVPYPGQRPGELVGAPQSIAVKRIGPAAGQSAGESSEIISGTYFRHF